MVRWPVYLFVYLVGTDGHWNATSLEQAQYDNTKYDVRNICKNMFVNFSAVQYI